MIHDLLSKLFRSKRNHRKSSRSRKTYRCIALEPLETRRLLSATASISGFAYLDPTNAGQMAASDPGFAGLTVQLRSIDSQGNASTVSGVGPTQTLADGSYSFTGLSAGTYQVQVLPSAKLNVGTLSPGSAGGTAGTTSAGTKEIQLTLADAQAATDNDIAILGAQTNYISLRMYLASTGSLGNFLTTLHAAPTVETGDGSNPNYSGAYTTGGAAAAVTASDAAITATDSPTLAGMTVTIENPPDGSSEVLAATTTGTNLTQSYAAGALTISGVADIATYEKVLRSVTYSDSAVAGHAGARTISVVVDDGTTTSTAATSTITVSLGTQTTPKVTTNPAAQTVNTGGTATFTAAASGTPTPTVQWQVSTDGGTTFTNVSGATSTTYTVTAAASQNGYKYQAVFTNTAGTVTTSAATLTVDSVTTQPGNKSVNAGQSVTFTVASLNPSGADTVQWQVSTDGGTTFTNVTGATSPTYTFTTAAAQNGNQFRAVFTNTAGTLTSNAATLTVDSVTTQPGNKSANAGQSVSLTAATVSSSDTVQWQQSTDGGTTFTNISGATSTTYTFTAAAAQNSNEFRAVFTNTAGSLTSNAATLTVDSITTQPSSQTVNPNQSVTFTAASVNPSGADTVQWQQSTDSGATFTNISGATSATYTFTASTAQNNYQYRAVFTNTAGTLTSNAATLSLNFAPVVTTNPTNTLANAGGAATFTAAASGGPAPTVQWQVSTNGGTTFTNISGATSTTYTFTAATAQNGNEYRAVFTNTGGTATTTAATLSVDSITTQPASQTVNAGQSVTFTAGSFNPSGADTVQWQQSTDSGATFTNISGATSATYSFTASTAQNNYQYRAVFTNTAGTLNSNAATLSVNFAPVVTTNPADVLANAGGTATFTAAASGNPAPTVQWQIFNGTAFTNIPGATSATYTFTATAAETGNKYQAVFTNSFGTVTTSPATLTVDSVTTQPPASQLVNAGQSVSFTVASFNPGGADTVQWQSSTDNGTTFTNITGATSLTYTFTATSSQNGEQFRAVFSNTAGTFDSNAATLGVDYVATQPASQTVSAGQNVTFYAASNSAMDTVQWQASTDGGTTFTNISGATSTTYTFTAATAQNGEEYRAVFTNGLGTLTSSAATLTVHFAPTVTTNPATASANAGGSVSFTAAANGNPSPTVQWQTSTDGGTTFTNVSGATSATYTFTAAASQNGNQFRAVFTNSVGSVTTTAATLSVDSITTQPASQTVNANQSVTFTAASFNPSGADTVQWQVSTNSGATFTDISGATSATYTFTASTAQNGDQYRAVFTNSVGTLTSSAATLTVDFAPTVTTNPADVMANNDGAATFTAAASGNPTPTVQWQISTDGGTTFNNISGATSATYSFTAAVSQIGNKYRAVFTNSVGTVTTTAGTLAVDSITTQPGSETLNVGQSATLTAASSNPGGHDTVQWQVSTDGGTTFTNISGATSASYTFTASAPSGNEYRAVFTNSAGTLTSNGATVTVDYVSTQPANQTFSAGQSVTFTAISSNPGGADTVQWQVSTDSGATFTNVSGATSTSYTFTADTTQNGNEYRAVFSNTRGAFASNPATLSVVTAPAVTTNPTAATVNAGGTATFTAAASGAPTPTVQWQVSTDGGTTFTNISGATSATYSFTAAATQNGNEFRAVFTNSKGTATTTAATLTVDTAPVVTTNPTAQSGNAGGTVTFTAAASGAPTPTVQWMVDTGSGFQNVVEGNGISGSTTTSMKITPTAAMNGYRYEAVFTNSVSSATTTPATLTVDSITTQPASVTVAAGSNATFTAATSNSADTVQWKVSTDGGTTFTNISGATSTTYTVTSATTTQNTSQYEAVFTNSAGTLTTLSATLRVNTGAQNTWPTGYTVTPNHTTYGLLQSNIAGFTINSPSAASGDSFTYSIASSGGGTPITGSGTISSTSQTVGGNIDLKPLSDGTLTFTVILSDAAGDAGQPATATAVVDRAAPPAFTVTPDVSTVTDANDKSFGFQIGNAEVNDAYTWFFLYQGIATNVRGNGTVTNSTMHLTGIDMSSLPSANYTLHVILTDPVGNGTAGNVTVKLSKAVPAFTVTANVPYINATAATNAGFTFANAETLTTYTYTVTSSNGGGPTGGVTGSGSVNSATQNVSAINVSALNDGTLTYSVKLTDAFGNTLTEQTMAVLDRVAPSGYTLSNVPTLINATASKNVGFTINTSSGEIGDKFVYTITSEKTGFSGSPVTGSGTIAAVAHQVTGVDVSSLPDSTLSFTVVLNDKAGNAGSSSTPVTATLDTVAPTNYSLTADQTILGSKTAAANASFTINSPASENGDTFTWSVGVQSGNPPIGVGGPTGSGVINSTSQQVTGIDLSALPDGTVTYSVTLTNAAGNVGAAATATAALATTAPSGFTVTSDQPTYNTAGAASAGLTIAGATVGDTYHYNVTDNTTTVTGSGTMTAATQDITGVNLSSLAPGTITFSVNLTDVAGHTSTTPATATAKIDPYYPTAIALSSSSAYTVGGSLVGVLETAAGQSGGSYTYSLVNNATYPDNANFQIPTGTNELRTADAFTGSQGTYHILLKSTDAAGNSIQQPFTITVNASDPIAATLTLSNDSVSGGQAAGVVVGNLTAGGAVIGNQIGYSLVSEPGTSNDNSLFAINGNQLQTNASLTSGHTYTVRVRSSSTFLISDVVKLSNVSGPFAFQVTLDPSVLPSGSFATVAANAGLIALGTDGSGTGNWVPAISANSQLPGSLAQPNYQGSYASFWASVQAAHPTATLNNVVGSSGVDLTNHTAWAVVDQPGEYAVAVTVVTEQTFTITAN